MKINVKYVHLLLTCAPILFFCYCGGEANQTSVQPSPTTQKSAANIIPPLAMEAVVYIHENTEQIDYTFNNLPFSSNASGPNVRSSINMFNDKPVMNQGCAPQMGTAIFTGKGQVVATANFFSSPGCNYWLINFRGGSYANQMSENGINYFRQLQDRVKAN